MLHAYVPSLEIKLMMIRAINGDSPSVRWYEHIAKVRKAANFLRDVPFAGARGVFRCLDHPTFSSGGRIRAYELPVWHVRYVSGFPKSLSRIGHEDVDYRLCAFACSRRRTLETESSSTCIDFKKADQSSAAMTASHWRLSEYLNAMIRRGLVDILRALYDHRNLFITMAVDVFAASNMRNKNVMFRSCRNKDARSLRTETLVWGEKAGKESRLTRLSRIINI